MREEMEKIKDELIDDMKTKKDPKLEKRLSIELEKAKLKEKEAEIMLRNKAQLDEMLLKYKGELTKKDTEIQQMQKAYFLSPKNKKSLESLQGKIVMMKAERDKLIDISNDLRVELNKLKKHQSPQKENVGKTYKEKLEKLKQNYNNLGQISSEEIE